MGEQVLTENDYYDGPKSGTAFFAGAPHRFFAIFDESEDEFSEFFLLWPIGDNELRLEIEQWCIFVDWNDQYEAGVATTESHPGNGGINARWDEIERLLRESRRAPQSGAIRAKASFRHIDRDKRYTKAGPSYNVVWTLAPRAV